MNKNVLNVMSFLSLSAVAQTRLPFDELPDMPRPRQQFLSAIQFAVQETHPQLLESSRKLVREEFARSFDVGPGLKAHHYEVRNLGNEVIFFVSSNDDLRMPMQQVVSLLIETLNGRVRGRGRSFYYETSLPQREGGFLEVVGGNSQTRQVSAQGVPLRKILQELRAQSWAGEWSYVIPGDCADQLVDWRFGSSTETEGKNSDQVMSALAEALNLNYAKRRETYVLTGNCNELAAARMRRPPPGADFLPVGFFEAMAPEPRVYIPLPRIAD